MAAADVGVWGRTAAGLRASLGRDRRAPPNDDDCPFGGDPCRSRIHAATLPAAGKRDRRRTADPLAACSQEGFFSVALRPVSAPRRPLLCARPVCQHGGRDRLAPASSMQVRLRRFSASDVRSGSGSGCGWRIGEQSALPAISRHELESAPRATTISSAGGRRCLREAGSTRFNSRR